MGALLLKVTGPLLSDSLHICYCLTVYMSSIELPFTCPLLSTGPLLSDNLHVPWCRSVCLDSVHVPYCLTMSLTA